MWPLLDKKSTLKTVSTLFSGVLKNKNENLKNTKHYFTDNLRIRSQTSSVKSCKTTVLISHSISLTSSTLVSVMPTKQELNYYPNRLAKV